MKKAINGWSFPPGSSLEQMLAMAAEAGFEGIELNPDASGPVALGSSAQALDEVRAKVEKAGLQIASLACSLAWDAVATHPDPDVQAEALRINKQTIEVAAGLGVDAILVIPGAVEIPWIPSFPVQPYDVAYRRAQDFVKRLAESAEEKKIYACVENVWNGFLYSPLEMAGFVDSVGSDYVAAYFDVGNCIRFGYSEHWIQALGRRIKRVHFKDFKRECGNSLAGFVDLLEGDVAWPAVMQAFAEIGYDGWATAEMIPHYPNCPEVRITNTSRAMDAIFGLGE